MAAFDLAGVQLCGPRLRRATDEAQGPEGVSVVSSRSAHDRSARSCPSTGLSSMSPSAQENGARDAGNIGRAAAGSVFGARWLESLGFAMGGGRDAAIRGLRARHRRSPADAGRRRGPPHAESVRPADGARRTPTERVVQVETCTTLLWPATFVAESNLAALVNEVRRALDDNCGSVKVRQDGAAIRLCVLRRSGR